MNQATDTLGPLFLGLMFNLLLLGMIFVQYYMYIIKYQRRDKLWIRIFASGTILYMVDMYMALILNFGSAARSTWHSALTAIMAGAVQLFFAWRVKVLTSSWISTASVCFTALLAVAGGIATAAEANAQQAVSDFQTFKITVIIWLVSSCVCDFLITAALVWYLYRSHKTGFEQSDELMDRIIRLTVQTGLITSICAMLDLITFLAIASPNVHIIFTGMLGKLYTNALMSSLNARSGWSYSTSSKTMDTSRKKDDVVRLTTTNTEVFVQVERHEMRPMGTQRVSESEDWEAKPGDMV
ncbi:hypothetical protein IW261DRAFT_1507308 [Armillaria novae-zelandiae]|uniref:DUF6534 domain-containing protein n=1 Tax=Armillaria novae-zelandiae TaxID=153914 RepID=A0AA39U212_9AGAR|nr:hypothetical protein IW261DRAFT_1507308 [Armillaria novae-zelandiae]